LSLHVAELREGRHSTVRRQLVDHSRKKLRQLFREFFLRQAGFLGKRLDDVRAQDRAELAGLDRLVLSAADPGADDAALAALLDLLQQPAQSAEQATEPVAGLLRRRRRALSASALGASAFEQRA